MSQLSEQIVPSSPRTPEDELTFLEETYKGYKFTNLPSKVSERITALNLMKGISEKRTRKKPMRLTQESSTAMSKRLRKENLLKSSDSNVSNDVKKVDSNSKIVKKKIEKTSKIEQLMNTLKFMEIHIIPQKQKITVPDTTIDINRNLSSRFIFLLCKLDFYQEMTYENQDVINPICKEIFAIEEKARSILVKFGWLGEPYNQFAIASIHENMFMLMKSTMWEEIIHKSMFQLNCEKVVEEDVLILDDNSWQDIISP